MSWKVEGAVWTAELGTLARKAVMAYFANKASDDGTGIWASKQTMADELCCSDRHIRKVVSEFLDEGLLREVGKRANPNGFTIEYAIIMPALEALPRVPCHSRAAPLHQPELALRGGGGPLNHVPPNARTRERARTPEPRSPLNHVPPNAPARDPACAPAHNAPARTPERGSPLNHVHPLNDVQGTPEPRSAKQSLNHKKSSVANATGDREIAVTKKPNPFDDDYVPAAERTPPPPTAIDIAKIVIDSGRAILQHAGLPEAKARAMMGKWRQQIGDEAMLVIIRQAEATGPSAPLEYFERAVRNRTMTNGTSYRHQPRDDDFLTAEELADEVIKANGWDRTDDDDTRLPDYHSIPH